MLGKLFNQDYCFARFIFQKGIAFIYALGFIIALDQFKALMGSNGLIPVTRFLKHVNFHQAPSVFHWHYSDGFFQIICWIGLILSLALLFGWADNFTWWGSALVWFIPWLLYLSIVNIGQVFYGFGWESLLLEAGFLAILIGASQNAVPFLIILLLRWLLFRVEFGAGLIKLRGDQCWRDFTCLFYHHETQPMPNPLSWYFHNLPLWFHKLEGIGNFFFQLVVPVGFFFPQPISSIAAILIILSQLWLVLSGNFSWLNLITIVIAFSAISDSFIRRFIPTNITTGSNLSNPYQIVVFAVTLFILFLSYWPAKNMISSKQKMNASFNRYHLVNTYGAFGSVTKKRHEIIIEGTNATKLSADTIWQEYEFKGKPGDISKMPPQYAPYHLRLDWLMWFASFGMRQQQHWFIPLIEKLLHNDKELLKLIKHNPFPEKAPKFIRARYYHYQFTSPEEKKASANYWKRKLVGEYLKPVSLK